MTRRRGCGEGTFYLRNVIYMVGAEHAFTEVIVVVNGERITVTDTHGEILIEHTQPAPGVRYVGNGKPRGTHPKNPGTSPKS